VSERKSGALDDVRYPCRASGDQCTCQPNENHSPLDGRQPATGVALSDPVRVMVATEWVIGLRAQDGHS